MRGLAFRAAVAAALVLSLGAGTVAAETAESPYGNACVGLQGDAQCRNAVSVTGNASSHLGLVAASGTGDAECGPGLCAAASGTGDATAFVPASATGDCRQDDFESYRPCQEATLEEDAEAYNAAVSVLGDAESEQGVAVSVAGDATCWGAIPMDPGMEPCLAASGSGDAWGCGAVSVTGKASPTCGVGLHGVWVFPAVSGCEAGEEAGADAACADPEDALLP